MRDILIVIAMGVLYFAAFFKAPEKYTPFEGQKIYSLFDKEDTGTEESQPGGLALVDYGRVKTERKEGNPEKAAKVEKLIKEQKKIKESAKKKQITEVVEAVKKEEPAQPPAALNYQSLHQIITESNGGYFYQLQQESNEVILHLISYTPYNDKGILKIKIENNSRSYFFYSSISVQGISTQVFGPQFVKSNGSSILYLSLNNVSNKSNLILTVTEQQSKRIFKINFFIP